MAMLTKGQFLKPGNLKKEKVDLPEMGKDCFLYVRKFTAGEFAWLESEVAGETDGKVNLKNYRIKVVMLTTVDEDGNRLFEEKDIDKLRQVPADVITTLYNASRKLNDLDQGEDDTTKK